MTLQCCFTFVGERLRLIRLWFRT